MSCVTCAAVLLTSRYILCYYPGVFHIVFCYHTINGNPLALLCDFVYYNTVSTCHSLLVCRLLKSRFYYRLLTACYLFIFCLYPYHVLVYGRRNYSFVPYSHWPLYVYTSAFHKSHSLCNASYLPHYPLTLLHPLIIGLLMGPDTFQPFASYSKPRYIIHYDNIFLALPLQLPWPH